MSRCPRQEPPVLGGVSRCASGTGAHSELNRPGVPEARPAGRTFRLVLSAVGALTCFEHLFAEVGGGLSSFELFAHRLIYGSFVTTNACHVFR